MAAIKEEKLHRVEENSKSDWEKIPENERTLLQKVAAKTSGIVTPGNALSLAGGILFAKGLYDFGKGKYAKGTIEMTAARAVDLADGIIADKTGTKSLTGAGVDAGIDMVEAFAVLPVLLNTSALDPITTGVTGAQRGIHTVSSLVGKARGVRIDAHEKGKEGVAILWLGAMSAFAAKALEEKQPVASKALKTLGTTAVLAGAIYSLPATIDYIVKGFGPIPDELTNDPILQFAETLESLVPELPSNN